MKAGIEYGEFDYNNGATALISFAVIAGDKNNVGILNLSAIKGFHNATLGKITYNQLSSEKHILKFRLLTKNYTTSYIEVYKATTASVILKLKLSADINTKLYDSAEEGNIPDGYSTIELEL